MFIYIYIPGTCLSFILGVEPSTFPIKQWPFGLHVHIQLIYALTLEAPGRPDVQ